MCKIAVFPYIKPGFESKALKLAQAMTPGMTKADKDGFGYLALGDSGIFGERWLDVKQAWKKGAKTDPAMQSAIEKMHDALVVPEKYNSFGQATQRIHCLALHGRLSTNSISLKNTHPFVSECETHGIIHNGVIGNSHEFAPDMKSSCDSEAILIQMRRVGFQNDPDKIQEVASQLSGYFAVASISRADSGNWYLDVIRDSSAELSAVFVRELQGFVFCTDPSIVYLACKRIGFKATNSFKVKPCTLLRFNPRTGETIAKRNFIERIPEAKPIASSGWNMESRFDDPRYLSDPPGYRENDDLPDDPLEGVLDTVDYYKRLNRR